MPIEATRNEVLIDNKNSEKIINNDNESNENDDEYYSDDNVDIDDNDLFINTNRINRMVIQDSSSSDEDE